MTQKRIAWWTTAAALWTFIAWGSRIDLLTTDEAADPWTWIRVGGSLLFGVALAIIAFLLWRRRAFSSWMANVFIGFTVLMLVIWIRSVISVLAGDESAAFKTVHVVLAAISIGLGVILARIGLSSD